MREASKGVMRSQCKMPCLWDNSRERGNRAKKLGWLTLGYAVLLALAFSLAVLGAPAVGMSDVRIGDAHAEQNAATVVPVTIHNASDLGSIDLELSFDPAVVTVTSMTAGDFDVTISNLEETATGFAKIVAFQAANPGLNGAIVLAQVTLTAVGAVDATSPLIITVNMMTDATPHCRNLSYSVTNGSFTVIHPSEPTPTPTSTPPPGNGGGGQGGEAWRFLEPLDSDGDGYSDFYEHLIGSDPENPCDPDPTCAACRARLEELPVATPTASPHSTAAPSYIPSTPVPATESAPPSAEPQPNPFLAALIPSETFLPLLIALVLLVGLLILVVAHYRRTFR